MKGILTGFVILILLSISLAQIEAISSNTTKQNDTANLNNFAQTDATKSDNTTQNATTKPLNATPNFVIRLNDKTFEDYIKNTSVVLVYFFGKGCGISCKLFEIQYKKVALKVKNDEKPWIIADLNGTAFPDLEKRYNITGYPALKLFINDTIFNFEKDGTHTAVEEFLYRKTGPPYKELNMEADIKSFKDSKGLRVLFIGQGKEALGIYREVAKENNEYYFYQASEKDSKSIFPDAVEGQIVLLKDYDEMMLIYKEEITKEKINKFLDDNEMPLLNDFSDKVVDLISRYYTKKGVILFRSDTDPQASKLEEELHKVAKEMKGQEFVFIKTDIKEGFGKRVGDFFVLDESLLPTVVIVQETDRTLMYNHTGEIKAEAIKIFIEEFRKGKIPRYVMSEQIPVGNFGPFYKVVGKNFNQEVLENDLDVVVEFTASWCGNCKKVDTILKSLAEALVENKKIKFCEIEMTKNELPDITVKGYPHIKLFPGLNKTNVASLSGDRSQEQIVAFLKGNCSYPLEVPEVKPIEEVAKGKEDL